MKRSRSDDARSKMFTLKSIAEIKTACQRERQVFRTTGVTHSPTCVEMFRRAFEGEQDAWGAVVEVFQPEVRKQIQDTCKASNFPEELFDFDSIVQEVFAQFAKYAPKRADDLTATDELGRTYNFLKKCSKTQFLQAWRKRQKEGKLPPVEIDEGNHPAPASVAFEDQVELRSAIQERLEQLLESEEEKMIFLWRFEWRMKPKEIVEKHHDLFPDISVVHNIIQRLTRRLRKDKELLELAAIRQSQLQKPDPDQVSRDLRKPQRRKPDSDALLEVRTLDPDDSLENLEDKDVNKHCKFSDDVLLDYIMGDATSALATEIERSPACLQAAQRLADEMGPLLSVLYRLTCPDIDSLVDYQEGLLGGTARLVLHKHVDNCPLCQEELNLLQSFDQVSTQSKSSFVRRLVEAIFRPPTQLPAPVRGGTILRYESPDLTIDLSERKITGKARTWTLTGQLRMHDGQPFTNVDVILLQKADKTESKEHQENISERGTFRFRELTPGVYRLAILTQTEEIVVRELEVGHD